MSCSKQLFFLYFLFAFVFCNAQQPIIDSLVIKDNKKTKTSFIKKITRVKKGTLLDSALIEADILRLKRLPSIAHAYYQVEKTGENSYRVIYGIEENFTIIPSANIYTTNDDEFAFRIGLYEFNTFGNNITVGGFFQHDIFNSLGLNFKAPYLFSRKAGIAFNYQDWTTEEPVFLETGVADYKYNNESFELLGSYEFNFNHSVEAGINYFIETYNYIEGETSPEVPLNLKVNKLLYKFIYQYNNLDYYYQYVSGFKSVFNFQYVTSTDIVLPEFVIAWNDFLYYKRIGQKGNWASRLRLGLASNDDSPFAPFAVDNNLNIRGVGNVIDRGTGAIVLNTEYRHTFIDEQWFVLQGNAFIDGGSWRNPGGDFSDFLDSNSVRIYPGLGIRFIHKKIFDTIFRIDYGVGITPNATQGFVIGIGQYF